MDVTDGNVWDNCPTADDRGFSRRGSVRFMATAFQLHAQWPRTCVTPFVRPSTFQGRAFRISASSLYVDVMFYRAAYPYAREIAI